MYLVICGNPVDGFAYFGPFENSDGALLFAESEVPGGSCWWIAALDSPGGDAATISEEEAQEL